MSRGPDISVIVAVHNGAATIGPALRSIVLQSFADLEIILVDDASSDDSIAIARAVTDGRFRLIQNKTQLGLAASLNLAIGQACGRYIARMDADDLAFPDRLLVQHDYLEKNPQVDLVGTSALMFSENGDLLGRMPVRQEHQQICEAGKRGSFPLYHPTWMGRSSWFQRHPYDASFAKAQDYELLLRACGKSTYANITEPLLAYRYALGSSLRKRLQSRRAVWRAMRMHLPSNDRNRDLIVGAMALGAKTVLDVIRTAAAKLGQSRSPWFETPTADDERRWRQLSEAVTSPSPAFGDL